MKYLVLTKTADYALPIVPLSVDASTPQTAARRRIAMLARPHETFGGAGYEQGVALVVDVEGDLGAARYYAWERDGDDVDLWIVNAQSGERVHDEPLSQVES